VSESSATFDRGYTLDDKYSLESGRIFITGVQALVRLPLMQRQRDAAAGLNTAGFISGYRGSPLGTLDMALWQAKARLDAHQIHFEPGVNEDLAATAVWGSQQANLLEGPRYDGVFGIWYGKGPGVDRSCDALKHGNYAGSAQHGGVLVLAGDDPGAKSSSIAHQSEQALAHCGIPILNPSSVQDYLDLGIFGFALSRYSGCWVGFKCVTDTVESAASVSVDPERVKIALPEDLELSPGELNISWENLPLAVEHRLFERRHQAVQAFVRANGLDRTFFDGPERRLGIVTTGKAYLDVRQALEELGLDDDRAVELGLSIYKVAMPWPLEPVGARRFAEGLDELIVVEEKRPLIEEQLAAVLYNLQRRPRLWGKRDPQGASLVPGVGELSPGTVTEVLRRWLEATAPGFTASTAAQDAVDAASAQTAALMRLPSFCSGCPHNTSTNVPEGSVAMGGIGCHGMAVWLPERRTLAVTQMGGEGAAWIGQAPFTETPHIFQNLGDGTYFHSGLLAIRAAVSAGVSITYKILVNGAVAMTGGQRIEGESLEGEITTPEIVRQLEAEGVGRIAVVSDDIAKYARGAFSRGVSVHHRDQLDRVQRSLRDVNGVTAIVYDQTCAAEARRLRKKGEFPDPDRRVVINEAVCEGCGDCSVQSNCISIEPIETEFGRKRTINQSSCNKDFSCVKGLCPSFTSVIGGRVRKQTGDGVGRDLQESLLHSLPDPAVADASQPYNVYVAGIGGSGVVTVGALLGMAAHLEGKGCSVLDVTGLAQKNGPVSSHIRIAEEPDHLNATRIASGAADLVLGCDIVVTASADGLSKLSGTRTTVIANNHVAPTSDFATNADLDLSSAGMENAIASITHEDRFHLVASTKLATALMGDAIASNLFLVGYALQRGQLPVGIGALERAIELNGRAVEMNKRALAWGRLAAHDLAAVERAAAPSLQVQETHAGSADEIIARRVEHLEAYQDPRYARRYTGLTSRVAQVERNVAGTSERLTKAVAHSYAKLLAYKDEYEVARLYASDDFRQQIEAEFEGDYKLQFHLSPPLFAPRERDTGRFIKFTFGAWFMTAFRLLAKLKFLRGTPLDLFGYSKHRRIERQMIRDYETSIDELLESLDSTNIDLAVEIASLPEQVRGYDLVKDRQYADARAKQTELFDGFRRLTGSSSG
jgi:indolepyruvate ferredoxin oxidoreductase